MKEKNPIIKPIHNETKTAEVKNINQG
jgi:hypothetical protein